MTLELETMLAAIAQGRPTQPFAKETVALLADFSDVLLHHSEAKLFPELVALGFALRPAEIERLRKAFEQLSIAGNLLQPRGTVFQIAAGNVDTLFIHTWIFALLTGNCSVIRLSSKVSPQSDFLCQTLNRLLQDRPALRAANHFLRYGRDDEMTAALSAICDVRAIWGGDATVNSIRSIPVGPFTKELTFADRYSLAALSSSAYLAVTPAAKLKLAHDFYNDSFWFDQLACSSPRLVVWCGATADNQAASESFFESLESAATRRATRIEPSVKMRRFLYSCETAVEQTLTACLEHPHLTVLSLPTLTDLRREHSGGGVFLQFQTACLTDIAPFLTRKDQTMVYFGFERPELKSFVHSLNGRALDRVVPIGQALSFGRFWDGYDLLAEFTRSVALV